MARKSKHSPKSLAQQKDDFTSEGAPAPHEVDRTEPQRRTDATARTPAQPQPQPRTKPGDQRAR